MVACAQPAAKCHDSAMAVEQLQAGRSGASVLAEAKEEVARWAARAARRLPSDRPSDRDLSGCPTFTVTTVKALFRAHRNGREARDFGCSGTGRFGFRGER